MAVDAGFITMDDAACRRRSPATTGQGVATTRIADRGFGLTSAAVGTRRDTDHRIRALRRGTTARRITQFRMGYVSRTEDVKRLQKQLHLRASVQPLGVLFPIVPNPLPLASPLRRPGSSF